MKRVITAFSLSLLLACSSSPSEPAAPANATDPNPAVADAGASATPDDAAPADLCAAPAKSACGIESSWVRGIAHYDASHFKAGATPMLRVALRHQFTLFPGEEKIGGRLHAYTSIKVDPTKNELPFAVDMCGLGAAMWSEENGTFDLVMSIDENGNNNLDDSTNNTDAIAYGTPDPTELQKMVPVDVSCHGTSACMDVTLDCTGTACLTIAPMKSCKKQTPSCKSDDAFCS